MALNKIYVVWADHDGAHINEFDDTNEGKRNAETLVVNLANATADNGEYLLKVINGIELKCVEETRVATIRLTQA